MKPVFATFTGVDAHTDLNRLLALADEHHCEFGVLFSEAQQGQNTRYPSPVFIEDFLETVEAHPNPVRTAAHVCGRFARCIMERDFDAVEALPLRRFSRVQVNHTEPDLQVLEDFSRHIGRPVIAQWRNDDQFTQHSSLVNWLFDPSGGRGESAERWPMNATGELVGYSGGLSPDNIMEMIQLSRSPLYWVDMETGVRTNNRFDLDKVEAVLTALKEGQPASSAVA